MVTCRENCLHCYPCPFHCPHLVKRDDLINRQKAEIERMTDEACRYQTLWHKLQSENDALDLAIKLLDIGEIKSEAYREFMERLKWYVTESGGGISKDRIYSSYGIVGMIDIVYKELTEVFK